ncbi:thioesterase II family protein [Streptomyces sp. NPDC004296]|uniref:thioesterase II family protein n=1 Tax=Streptomyces sp. NPDC004296 TaxID=3364697 RepID=UPI0036A94093
MSSGKASATGTWFRSSAPRPEAVVRLFVLPHAGGSAASYAGWASSFGAGVEVQTVQLPGRLDRRSEPPFTEVELLVEALYDAMEAEWDGRPFALFGHSMGAMLSYRLTLAMQAEGGPRPLLLAVSGWAGAAHRPSAVPIRDIPDGEFLARVRGFGGLPPEISENEEMRELALPALRADFCVLNDYSHDASKVSCPLVAYCGVSDPLLAGGAMQTWSDLSDEFLGVSEFPGAHFYLFEHALSISADLSRHLRRAVAERRS